MILPTKSIWLAVYRIFSSARVGAGCSLSLKEMMQAWADTGLRQRDLAGALESLSRAGFLKLEMSPEGPRARMIDEGFGLLRADSKDQIAVTSLERLRESRVRPASHIAGLLGTRRDGRRAEDGTRPMGIAHAA